MEDQERKLLEGYRKLRPESKNLILSTILTIMAEDAVSRGLLTEIEVSTMTNQYQAPNFTH
jgi:hypothetical protein